VNRVSGQQQKPTEASKQNPLTAVGIPSIYGGKDVKLKVRFPKDTKKAEPVKEPKDFTSKTMRKGQAEVIARNIKANYKTIRGQAKPAKKKQSIHEKIAAEELIQKKLQKLFREGMPKTHFHLYNEQSDKRLLKLKQQLKGA
jgi:hypothetical protein